MKETLSKHQLEYWCLDFWLVRGYMLVADIPYEFLQSLFSCATHELLPFYCRLDIPSSSSNRL
jgi:hypothetical protein